MKKLRRERRLAKRAEAAAWCRTHIRDGLLWMGNAAFAAAVVCFAAGQFAAGFQLVQFTFGIWVGAIQLPVGLSHHGETRPLGAGTLGGMTHTGYFGVGSHGRIVHSFHPAPAGWCCANHVLGLALETDRQGAAVHEAGHVVAAFVTGIHVADVVLTTEQTQNPCGSVSGVSGVTGIGRIAVPVDDYLTMLAAGEAAHQRWLRDSGLHTPARAWAVEVSALDDVAKAVNQLRERVPGYDATGYRQLFWRYRPVAEELVDAHWERVLAVAGGLAAPGRLTGEQASDLAGLPNPPEPAAPHD
ncbi:MULTISPECIES: hypothetical protein [Streptomyces]|uniref:hypothetical protein n=1 Tax=Streptomyces nigra TaxID=1827580 RepID=UPI0036BF3DB0